MRLQAGVHPVAGWTAYGCSPEYIWLQPGAHMATHQHVPLTPTILPLVAMARTCFSTCEGSKYVVSKKLVTCDQGDQKEQVRSK